MERAAPMGNDEGDVGEQEAADIRAQVARVLRDLGDPEPPLNLDVVIEQLKLDFKYYSSTDLSTFDEIAHRSSGRGSASKELPWPWRANWR
jgi:hypothetical protein